MEVVAGALGMTIPDLLALLVINCVWGSTCGFARLTRPQIVPRTDHRAVVLSWRQLGNEGKLGQLTNSSYPKSPWRPSHNLIASIIEVRTTYNCMLRFMPCVRTRVDILLSMHILTAHG